MKVPSKVVACLLGLAVVTGGCAAGVAREVPESTISIDDCQQPASLRTSATAIVEWHNKLLGVEPLIAAGATRSDLVAFASLGAGPPSESSTETDADIENWAQYFGALIGVQKNLFNINILIESEMENNGWTGNLIDLVSGPQSVPGISEAHESLLSALDTVEKAADRAFASGFASESCNEISPPDSQT